MWLRAFAGNCQAFAEAINSILLIYVGSKPDQ